MAHIKESVEVEGAVGAIYEEWMHFEELRLLHDLKRIPGAREARLTWRAEALTFAPTREGTAVTLRFDYDAIGPRGGIQDALARAARQLHEDLEHFKAFVEGRGEELWGSTGASTLNGA